MRTTIFILLLAALTSTAAADSIRIDRSSKPIVTSYITGTTGDGYVTDRGWQRCRQGGDYTTAQPTLTFEVTEDTDLRISLENATSTEDSGSGAIIVFPDRSYLCDDKQNKFFLKSWPKGRYSIYLQSGTRSVGAVMRFEVPSRIANQLAATVQKLPVVTLGGAAINPIFKTVPATMVVGFDDAGPTCAKPHERVMPLARLVVTKAASWFIDHGDDKRNHEMFVLTEDHHCVNPREADKLAAGTHTLWAIVPAGGPVASYPLELDDRDSLIALPEARKLAVPALDKPLVLDGAVRPTERWSSRSDMCREAARAPDFYLTSDKPLQKVTISLLWSHAHEVLHLWGPIEKLTANSAPSCANDHPEHHIEILEGTYAVWVGGEAGAPYHVLVTREGTKLDPLTTLAEIPAELPLGDRAIKHHYPYFTGKALADWTKLFTTAPEQLFTYPRVDVAVDGEKLLAGEVLMIDWSNGEQTQAIRHDGRYVSVDSRLLSTTRPEHVVVSPTTKTVTMSLQTAIDEAGPDGEKADATYRAAYAKFENCYDSYMAKHDPTWNNSDHVYAIRGGKVVNVGDQAATAANNVCGGSQIEALSDRLEKQLATARVARYKAHLAAVRKRFGL